LRASQKRRVCRLQRPDLAQRHEMHAARLLQGIQERVLVFGQSAERCPLEVRDAHVVCVLCLAILAFTTAERSRSPSAMSMRRMFARVCGISTLSKRLTRCVTFVTAASSNATWR